MHTPPDTRILYKSEAGYHKAQAVYEWLCGFITIPYTTNWVNTPTGLTHVLEAGPPDAPVIVLLHGQGASAPTWNGQINILAQRYRVIAPDVPASMGKSTPNRLPRAGQAAGQWLAAVLDELHIPQAHLAGISNGAWLILKLATVRPGQIRSASLLSAAGFIRTSPRLMLKALPLLLAPFATPERKLKQFERLLGIPGQPAPEQDRAMFEVLLGDFKTEPTPAPLPEAELKCLTAPTQLLIGQYEAAFPAPGVIDRARVVLPNLVHSEVLVGVGHGMITENVALVSERLIQFIDQVERNR